MPLKYEISPDKKMIVATATGSITRDDFDQMRHRLLSDDRITGAMDLLLDANAADALLSFTDLQEIAARLKGVFEKGIVRVAIVSKSTFVYSLAKTFGVFAEREPVSVKPFREVDEAVAWLKSAA